MSQPPTPPPPQKKTPINLGVIVLGIVGLLMSMQSTSLLDGTGTIWLGVAVVAAALAASLFLSGSPWVRLVAALMLVLALGSALYVENQLHKQRIEITEMFKGDHQ